MTSAQVRPPFEISEGIDRTDFERVHGWLSGTYWSPGIARERVERAARNSSLVLGAYVHGVQAGYLRVVSDRASFAWICDVYVDEGSRGQGIARAMVRHAVSHPEHQGLRRWLLATADAQGVYAECGFRPLDNPERFMFLRPVSAEHWEEGLASRSNIEQEDGLPVFRVLSGARPITLEDVQRFEDEG